MEKIIEPKQVTFRSDLCAHGVLMGWQFVKIGGTTRTVCAGVILNAPFKLTPQTESEARQIIGERIAQNVAVISNC